MNSDLHITSGMISPSLIKQPFWVNLFLNGDDRTTGVHFRIDPQRYITSAQRNQLSPPHTIQNDLNSPQKPKSYDKIQGFELFLSDAGSTLAIPPMSYLDHVYDRSGHLIQSIDEIYANDCLYFCYKDEQFQSPLSTIANNDRIALPSTGRNSQNSQDSITNTTNTINTAQSLPPPPPTTTVFEQNPENQYHYIANTSQYLGNLLSWGYCGTTHAIRQHAPQYIVDNLNSIETTISTYSKDIINSSGPMLSHTVSLSDQAFSQCINLAEHSVHNLAQTSTGKQIQTISQNVITYVNNTTQTNDNNDNDNDNENTNNSNNNNNYNDGSRSLSIHNETSTSIPSQ